MVINVEQAKAQLDALIDRSTAGEDVIITRDGRPVARMVAVNGSQGAAKNDSKTNGTITQTSAITDGPPQRLGWGKDIITYIASDFDEPLEDFREYVE